MAAAFFLILVRSILAPFVFAAFLSYVLEPAVSFFQQRGMSRVASIALLYLTIFVAVILVSLYFVPRFLQDLTQLSEGIPNYVGWLKEFFGSLAA